MSQRACEYIDLVPCILPALELGARAILAAQRNGWEQACASIDPELTPSQYADLTRWVKRYVARPGAISNVHTVFWERGVSFGIQFVEKPVAQTDWQRFHVNDGRFCEYITRMTVAQEGWVMTLLTSDVYRCIAAELGMGMPEAYEELSEAEHLDVENHFHELRRVAQWLFQVQDTIACEESVVARRAHD